MLKNTNILLSVGAVVVVSIIAFALLHNDAVSPGYGIEPDTSWRWTQTKNEDSTLILPHGAKPFIVTFAADGSLSVTGDCNSIGGQYKLSGTEDIDISSLFSTKMFCEGSQETDFMRDFEDVDEYIIDGVTMRLYMSDDAFMTFTRA